MVEVEVREGDKERRGEGMERAEETADRAEERAEERAAGRTTA